MDKKEKESQQLKCSKCEFFNKDTKKCKNGNDCSKTNFTKCSDFIIKKELVMF